MVSSPGGGNYSAPARQGPPIEQLNPAQGPPGYPSFISGSGPQTGLTPEMLAAITANQGPGPMAPPQQQAAPPAAAPARQQLAQVLARQQQHAQQYNRERGGGSSR